MKLVSFGKSMYGGWYINVFANGNYTGKHFDKMCELRGFANKNGLTLKTECRLDN